MDNTNTEFFHVILAGVKVEIICRYRYVLNQCRDYLSPFDKPEIVVSANNEEIEGLRTKDPEILNYDPRIAMRYADDISESFIIYKNIAEEMLAFNTFLMHGAVIAADDKAYMFTAPSGVGKTTRIKLWMDEYPNSLVINGDKPLIKIGNNAAFACGTPWCGKEGWNTNTMKPLHAIFLLERSSETRIDKISLGRSFPFLLEQTHRPVDPLKMKKTVQLLKQLDQKVSIYKLLCPPNIEAIRFVHETICPRC